MKTQRKFLFVSVLIASLLMGLVSISNPGNVRADEAPPIPYGPNGEIPLGYVVPEIGPHFSEEMESGFQEDLDPKPEEDARIQAGGTWHSYGARGFNTYTSTFLKVGYGCLKNGETTERNAVQTVNIPHGSKIYAWDISGIDKNPFREMVVLLSNNRFNGAEGNLYTYLSSGKEFQSGNYYVVKYEVNHVVDNNYYNYTIQANYPEYSANEVALCQVTIYYIPPSPFGQALPIVTK